MAAPFNKCKMVFVLTQKNSSSVILKPIERPYPPGMRRRSDISIRSHLSRNVADHDETSSRRRNRYVNETDLFETSLRRLSET